MAETMKTDEWHLADFDVLVARQRLELIEAGLDAEEMEDFEADAARNRAELAAELAALDDEGEGDEDEDEDAGFSATSKGCCGHDDPDTVCFCSAPVDFDFDGEVVTFSDDSRADEASRDAYLLGLAGIGRSHAESGRATSSHQSREASMSHFAADPLESQDDDVSESRMNHLMGLYGADAAPPAVVAPVPYFTAGPSDLAIRAMIDRQPIRVGDDEESELLEAAHAADGPALLAAISGRIATLEGHPQADVRTARANGIDWIGTTIAPLGLELARLRATLRALESAKPGRPVALAYVGPSRVEVLDATGYLVAHAALVMGDRTLDDVLSAAFGYRPSPGEDPGESLARAAASFLASGASGQGHREAHARLIREADRRALSEAFAALFDGDALEAALAESVSSAVESSGGRAALLRDLGEFLSLDPTPTDPNALRLRQLEGRLAGLGTPLAADPDNAGIEASGLLRQRAQLLEAMARRGEYVPKQGDPHPDEAERSRVESELASAGATPNSPEPGRSVAKLQARHRELTEAIARRRLEKFEKTTGEAARLVESSLAGDLSAFEKLRRAVHEKPKAFDPSLGKALDRVPVEALGKVPCGAFAAIRRL